MKGALLTAGGDIIASAYHSGSVPVPKWDLSDCDFAHGDTCVKSVNDQLASFTRVMLPPDAQVGGQARRGFFGKRLVWTTIEQDSLIAFIVR